jgi:hypothetical protein
MLPYEDLEIVKIENRFRRSDECMVKYPNIKDRTCDTCPLNPIRTDEDKKAFIEDAIEHPTNFGVG